MEWCGMMESTKTENEKGYPGSPKVCIWTSNPKIYPNINIIATDLGKALKQTNPLNWIELIYQMATLMLNSGITNLTFWKTQDVMIFNQQQI